jgi:leucyl-tRNA synthetase
MELEQLWQCHQEISGIFYSLKNLIFLLFQSWILKFRLKRRANPTKEGKYINSDFIDGLEFKAATNKLIEALEIKKIGYGKVNFRMRDAGFSRQRYWGEPFPIFYENGIPKLLELKDLPLELPEVISYKPAGSGESPLSTATKWGE